ncbi:cytochrome ubiquinol oxidase subunit I [Actinorugispora endophytica]|uniref:Cytochrome bd-I ubiquinol oxidase subunit 1 apoprotein n=1 Tax=Actinorugispora endophytica TaxID=1605990 RepID=A0A4R6UXJ7_9ACTN|nr:cytochrome ubiquinol oxidase subunit I [Actinorugispora endophytica]TDQ52147.1 cytochrome bd-I ubiquinol oxidase subunit 1 apoprotein [Actinorugispora endophytica]
MFDDPLMWARLQFALTAGIHYMFVAFTLGMAPMILGAQLGATLRGDAARMAAVRFWGGLYVVNYGMGVLSGLVMELQLALNWSGLNDVFGHVFSAPLAIETVAAFFVESTFLGLWIFGWDRMNRWAHLAAFGVVTLTAYLSAFWVLVSNGFLKNPVGFEMRGGVAVLTDPAALVANPSALLAFGHVASSTLLVGGLVTAAVSAYHLRRGDDPDGMFGRGVRRGLLVTALAVMPTPAFGGTQYALRGAPATSGQTLDEAEIERIEAAGAGAAPVLADIGNAVMTLSWLLVLLLTSVSLLVWLLRGLDRWRWFHALLVFAPVLPLAASVAGWLYRELGRQPWAVRHHMTTADAVTEMSGGMAATSFFLFTGAFAVLACVTWWLIARFARRGPEGGPLAPAPDPGAEPASPIHTY